MKNYMDIINAETELLKKKRKLELDYENEMKAIEKRLAEYEEYKNDFKNGNGDWALAKEYVTLYKPFNLLRRFDTFIPKLKDAKQYYIRIRVEKDKEFGAWSDIATFTYDGKDRVLDRLEKSEKDPHKINPVSIWAPYNYKRNMHNNKVNLDTNPTSPGTMSTEEVNHATGLGLSPEVMANNNTTTSLSAETIERIMKDGNGNTATTIKLADGTIITRANDGGTPGVVVDETPAGTNIAPVIISALEVTRRPQQGTNDAFVFEFNAEIKDEGILQNIEIIRKDF